MRHAFKVALHYLTSNPSQTGLLVLGVAVAVFIFVFMSALIGGLADLMVNRTLGGMAHVTVSADDRDLPLLDTGTEATVLIARQKSSDDGAGIRDPLPLLAVIDGMPGVAASSPQVTGGGVLIRGERIRQVAVAGLQPDRVTAIVPFDRYLTDGRTILTGDGLLIGATLARDLDLTVGRTVTLRTEASKAVTLRVSGIFETGLGSIDSATALVDIATARFLFDMPSALSRIDLKARRSPCRRQGRRADRGRDRTGGGALDGQRRPAS